MDIDWIALDMDCIGFEVAYLIAFDNGQRVTGNWIGLHWDGCVAVHICVAFDDRLLWIQWMSIGLHLSWVGLDWNLIITDCVEYGFGWIELDCIALVALQFTFAFLCMIGLFVLSGYQLDCISV